MKSIYEKLLNMIEKAEGDAIFAAQRKINKAIDTNQLTNASALDLLNRVYAKIGGLY